MTFINTNHLFIVLIVALVLLVASITLEFIKARKRRNLRILSLTIAISSAVVILLEPTRPSHIAADAAILLTSNYSQRIVDSLITSNPGMPVMHWDTLDTDLKDRQPLYLLGDGIHSYDNWRLPKNAIIYFPSPIPSGVIKCRYDPNVREGEMVVLQGAYHQPNNTTTWLKLIGPAGTLDSCKIRQEGITSFQLQTIADNAGRYLYKLQVTDSTGKMVEEPVPIQIKPKTNLKVLILNDFPTFETRTIKEYLSTSGHKVVTRYRLAKDKFKYEFFNTRFDTKPRYLLKDLLDRFDILITDRSTLNSLGPTEQDVLKEAVTQGGLGVFVQPGEEMFTNPPGWPRFTFSFINKENVSLALGDKPQSVDRFPYRVMPSFTLQAIVLSGDEPVVFYQSSGRGKVASSVLAKTYPLRLKGDSLAYEQLWNTVFENILAIKAAAGPVHSMPAYLDEPFEITTTSATGPMLYQGAYLPPLRNKELPGQTKYRLWPGSPGWNSVDVHIENDANNNDANNKMWFYVHLPGDWHAVRDFIRRQQSLAKFHQFAPASDTTRIVPVEVNRLWFYLLFLVCIGYLWLEVKW